MWNYWISIPYIIPMGDMVSLLGAVHRCKVTSLKITTDLYRNQENISKLRINVFYQYNISMGH